MEYIRKQRWANYNSIKCKEYLRNDFSHECAYCKLQEKDVGLATFDFFEIDHFIPQTLELEKKHDYSNLFYSCCKCNSDKSDTWENLLNPCEDDIFKGTNPPIKGGTKEYNYKYIAQNEKGTFYIDTFKLNSRRHIRNRKIKENDENRIREIDTLIDSILVKLRKISISDDLKELTEKLEEYRKIRSQELSILPKDELFESAEEYLKNKGIKYELVFEEYNIDIKVDINGNTYYCELLFDKEKTEKEEYKKYISIERIKTWFEQVGSNFGVLFYYSNIGRMYFCPISDLISRGDINGKAKLKQFILGDSHIL